MIALADRILINPIEPKTALHIVGKKTITGEVVSIGDAVTGSTLNKGMIVAYRAFQYPKINGHLVLREDEILAEII